MMKYITRWFCPLSMVERHGLGRKHYGASVTNRREGLQEVKEQQREERPKRETKAPTYMEDYV